MGIGINTGVVMAGAVGGGGRLEYTVMGDAVNVAQRLQAQAGAGQILATAATAAAAPSIATESLGLIQVKGRREPVEIHIVVSTG
jgi:class 3 adenylate cyclase